MGEKYILWIPISNVIHVNASVLGRYCYHFTYSTAGSKGPNFLSGHLNVPIYIVCLMGRIPYMCRWILELALAPWLQVQVKLKVRGHLRRVDMYNP